MKRQGRDKGGRCGMWTGDMAWLGRPPIHDAHCMAVPAYIEHDAYLRKTNLPKNDKPPFQFLFVNCHLGESICLQCGSVLIVPQGTVRSLLEEMKLSFPLAL